MSAWNQTPEYCREIGKLGGRPRGKKTRATLKKEAVLEEYRQMILRDAKRLFYSQSTLAHGQTYLFRIRKKQVGKDKWVIDGEPVLVKDPEEMRAFLDGLVHNRIPGPHEPYYFLTAVQPSQQAIADMLDRAFGKARQVVGLEGPTPGSSISISVEDKQYERILTEEFNRIGTAAAVELAPAERSGEAGAGSETSGD